MLTTTRSQPMQGKRPGATALVLGLAPLLLSINPGRADIAGHRYAWGELPITFVTPERVINGTTTCITNPYGNGERHHNHASRISNNWANNGTAYELNSQTDSTITTCTTTPARAIPSSSYTRLLQVQYDCTDQTYDAKDDGKAWRNVRAGYSDGAYDQFKRVCQIDGDHLDKPKP